MKLEIEVSRHGSIGGPAVFAGLMPTQCELDERYIRFRWGWFTLEVSWLMEQAPDEEWEANYRRYRWAWIPFTKRADS